MSLSRVLGEGEDPLTWSLPVFTSPAFQMRVHFLFVLVALWELMLSAPQGRIGPTHVFIGVGALLVLVAAREVGRWAIARRFAEPLEQVVLWPAGLLASAGGGSRPSVASALGGTAVSLALVPLLGGGLWAAGQGWDMLLFNPLDPAGAAAPIGSPMVAVLWWLYYLNAVLLGLNLVVPMFPLDGARIVEALLARRLGTRRAAGAACRIGLVASLVLFAAAMSLDLTRMIGLAVVGAGVCLIHLRRVEFVQRPAPAVRESPARVAVEAPPEDRRGGPAEAQADAEDTAEVDRILAKISATGLESLTAEERRALESATERRRNRKG